MNFGRLLEVGTAHELYQHPQTEFVATFLGTTNLLLGEAKADGVQLGPLFFPLDGEAGQINKDSSAERVQVMFRPEDVTIARPDEALTSSQLGEGKVEESAFSGSFERLRLRLPPISKVRPIAPPVAYGDDTVLIEATRSQDIARRFPLQPGDNVKVGVKRIHALPHPGLSFLILTDASETSQNALTLGGQIARLAHARVTILSYGLKGKAHERHLQEAKETLGSGLALVEGRSTSGKLDAGVTQETDRQPYDLVILGFNKRSPSKSIALAESILKAGDHHLLLVPAAHTEPTNALVCVTGGEPGKENVLFAGRFLRHMGAKATLLSVLPPGTDMRGELHDRTQRFLSNGVRTLDVLGVPSKIAIKTGSVREEVKNRMQTDGYDLLIIGASLTKGGVSLEGVVSHILEAVETYPVLIIHSHYTDANLHSLEDTRPYR
jgi:hypothetical protein